MRANASGLDIVEMKGMYVKRHCAKEYSMKDESDTIRSTPTTWHSHPKLSDG